MSVHSSILASLLYHDCTDPLRCENQELHSESEDLSSENPVLHQESEDCYSPLDCGRPDFHKKGEVHVVPRDPSFVRLRVFIGPSGPEESWDGTIEKHPKLGEYVTDSKNILYTLVHENRRYKLFCKNRNKPEEGYIYVEKPGFLTNLFSANPAGGSKKTYRKIRDEKTRSKKIQPSG